MEWQTVLHKKNSSLAHPKSVKAVTKARRDGKPVDTIAKAGGGMNKKIPSSNAFKLEEDQEMLRHAKVPLEVSQLIAQGRLAKGLSQRDLAAKICERSQVICDYEAGRGIPNHAILGKIERVIGIKLRGKERGQPIELPGHKKK